MTKYSFEVCHPEKASDIEEVWPIIVETLDAELSETDAVAAYAAKVARDSGEGESDAALADAWERAESSAYNRAFAGWHKQPETLTIYAL